jgi:hypothetical protein
MNDRARKPADQERIQKLAERIRSDSAFADELAAKIGNLGKTDRETVIAAVVTSGVCDAKIVRAIRSEFGAFAVKEEELLRLDDFERDYAAMKRD